MTAPSDGDSCCQRLANRGVPHMSQSQYSTPKHNFGVVRELSGRTSFRIYGL